MKIDYNSKDWEDVKAPYQEECCVCHSLFWGHRDMIVCKECANEKDVECSKEKK